MTEPTSEQLRGGPPGPFPFCTDCGRAMVWGWPPTQPAWMCPSCVDRMLQHPELCEWPEMKVYRVQLRKEILAELAASRRERVEAALVAYEAVLARERYAIPPPEVSELRAARAKLIEEAMS